MAIRVPTVLADSNRKGVVFNNSEGTIPHDASINFTGSFTISYTVKQRNVNCIHYIKGNDTPSTGCITIRVVGKKLQVTLFSSNDTNAYQITTVQQVLASVKAKCIQVVFDNVNKTLSIYIDNVSQGVTVTSGGIYLANLTGFTLRQNTSDIKLGSYSGETNFDGDWFGAEFIAKVLNPTELYNQYQTLKDTVTVEASQKIAFASNRFSGSIGIAEMDENGNDISSLSTARLNVNRLRGSNAGKIIFGHETYEADAIDIDGSITTPVVLPPGIFGGDFTFEHDDNGIVLYSGPAGIYNALYRSINGGTPTVLAAFSYIRDICAKGNYMYYIESAYGWHIKRIPYPSLTTPQTLYSEGGGNPGLYAMNLSPDGTKIGFSKLISPYFQVFVMDSDGANPLQITFNNWSSYFGGFNQDNSKIVWFAAPDGVHSQIYRANANGTNAENISNNLTVQDSWPIYKI